MPGKTVPLSVRVSDDDAVFLAGLEIDDAVTPSEKLRAILQDTKRRHAGLKDASEGGLLMREMATPARRQVRRIEGRIKRKSDLVLKLYERVPDIMARLIAGPETEDAPDSLIQFEDELTDQITVLLKDFITLGLTSPVRVYAEDNFRREMKPVTELVELLRHHQRVQKRDQQNQQRDFADTEPAKDRMRVDVQAEFYVRVQPTIESIANAAQTLGRRTMTPDALKELIEGKFVDSLRAVAAEMAMEELHEQRVSFVQKVQAAVSEDILKNGLELESVSLTGLDQTNKEYFNPDNAFDAEGLTKLTQEIEERRKKRNDIEQETEVLIQRKNLDAEQQRLLISRDQEYARLEQQREVEVRKADQVAQIAREQAQREYEAEQAKIEAGRQTKEASIEAAKVVAERQIEKDRLVREQEIAKEQSVEAAAVEKAKQIALAEQGRDIAVAEKSREKSEADAAADAARAVAVKAEEAVVTSRHTEVAEREKQIELIEAQKVAEQQAIAIKVSAETEKLAAIDKAEAIRIAADAEAEKERIAAAAEADAAKAHADGQRSVYEVEAEGKRAVNEASNTLSPEQIAMQIKLELIKALPEIIAQSVKPMEAIDGIKIVQVDGLNGTSAGTGHNGDASGTSAGSNAGAGGNSLPDQAVAAALRYRTQAPLLDSLLNEVGLDGNSLAGLTSAATASIANGAAAGKGEARSSRLHSNGNGKADA